MAAPKLVVGDLLKQGTDVVQIVGIVEPPLLLGVRGPRARDAVRLVLARDLADVRCCRGHAHLILNVVAPLVS